MKVFKSLLQSTALAAALIIAGGLPNAHADDGRMYDICHNAVAANAIAYDQWYIAIGAPDEHWVSRENKQALAKDGLCEVAEIKVPKGYVPVYRHDYDEGIGIIVIPVLHKGMDMFAVVDELIESESAPQTVQVTSE